MTKLTPTITARDPNVRAEITHISSEGAIDIFRVNITFPENTVPTPVHVHWDEEFLNILNIWAAGGRGKRNICQWFGPRDNYSCFSCGAPILSAIGANDGNTVTVSVSDVSTPINISLSAKNSQRGENLADYIVEFFAAPCPAMKDYTADIRIDRRAVPFYEAILSVSPWWAEYGHIVPPCPPAAEDPLYSTWYSCCNKPVGADILEDLKVAAEAGFKTIILDDGWQIEGESKGGYSSCGDWIVGKDKFPDFKAFADGVHALGMKLMVWFATPFMGYEAEAYKRFEGMFLEQDEHLRCAVLDPRYPEVRRYTVDTYARFLRDYDIDGFKLDFIGSLHSESYMPPANDAMDCATVEEAVLLLLTEITEELAKIKPDLLYEYRQGYIGPAINRFGNMLRVGDCAYDGVTNRLGMVDLRLLGYPIAIHSDMLCWSPMEDAKLCAKQLLDILFCVPQISVFLADSTEEQKRLLRHYLDYWTENRDLLLHGTFRASAPGCNYTEVSAENDEKIIAVLYADSVFTYTGKTCDIHLNGNRDGLIFENPTEQSLTGEIYDCFGTLLHTVEIGAGAIVRLPVPETGMLHVR